VGIGSEGSKALSSHHILMFIPSIRPLDGGVRGPDGFFNYAAAWKGDNDYRQYDYDSFLVRRQRQDTAQMRFL
jgi:hypothetical protein